MILFIITYILKIKRNIWSYSSKILKTLVQSSVRYMLADLDMGLPSISLTPYDSWRSYPLILIWTCPPNPSLLRYMIVGGVIHWSGYGPALHIPHYYVWYGNSPNSQTGILQKIILLFILCTVARRFVRLGWGGGGG